MSDRVTTLLCAASFGVFAAIAPTVSAFAVQAGPSLSPSSAVRSVTPDDSGLTFELGACESDEAAIDCELSVISHDIDRFDRIDCSGLTHAIDDRGRKLTCRQVLLAGKPTWGVIGTEALLVKDERTPLRVRFDNPSPGAQALAALRLSFADDLVWTGVEFKDVNVRARVPAKAAPPKPPPARP